MADVAATYGEYGRSLEVPFFHAEGHGGLAESRGADFFSKGAIRRSGAASTRDAEGAEGTPVRGETVTSPPIVGIPSSKRNPLRDSPRNPRATPREKGIGAERPYSPCGAATSHDAQRSAAYSRARRSQRRRRSTCRPMTRTPRTARMATISPRPALQINASRTAAPAFEKKNPASLRVASATLRVKKGRGAALEEPRSIIPVSVGGRARGAWSSARRSRPARSRRSAW